MSAIARRSEKPEPWGSIAVTENPSNPSKTLSMKVPAPTSRTRAPGSRPASVVRRTSRANLVSSAYTSNNGNRSGADVSTRRRAVSSIAQRSAGSTDGSASAGTMRRSLAADDPARDDPRANQPADGWRHARGDLAVQLHPVEGLLRPDQLRG